MKSQAEQEEVEDTILKWVAIRSNASAIQSTNMMRASATCPRCAGLEILKVPRRPSTQLWSEREWNGNLMWESSTGGMSLGPSSVGPYALCDALPVAPLRSSRDGLHIFRMIWRPSLHSTDARGTEDCDLWMSWEEREGHALTRDSHAHGKCRRWLTFSMN